MKGKAGIGKVALYGREYLIKVQPRERGLVMYTLRHAGEIRSMDAIDELADMPEVVKPDEVKLARQVIGTFEGDIDFASYKDEYQEGLREIIDAKNEGRADRGRRSGSAGSGGAAEGGEPDGSAAEESRHHQRVEEEGACDRVIRIRGTGRPKKTRLKQTIFAVPSQERRAVSEMH